MKLAFITYSMAPYRTKQFNEFTKQISSLELSVYYIGRSIKTRSWNVKKSEYFKEYALKGKFKLGNHFLFYKGIKDIVKKNDVFLLGGYNSTAMFIFLYYIKKYKKKAIFVIDGISPIHLNIKHGIGYFVKKFFLIRMDSYFANGQVSRKYLEENFQISNKKIFNQYLTVDVDKIHQIVNRNNIDKLSEKFIVMYSGRLLTQKRVKDIFKAVAMSPNKDKLSILIVGSGNEELRLKEFGKELELDVIYIDFVEEQEKLFELYGIVDCLVLPSEDDAWGLVINEAEAASLPVIVSKACGCVYDLVKDGVNGYSYEPGDIKDLSYKITQVYNAKLEEKDMGRESFEIISNWKFSNSVESFNLLLKKLGE